MGTVVCRPRKNTPLTFLGKMINDAIDWPDNAISAYRNHPHEPWKFKTTEDIRNQKIERMKDRLWMKRKYDVIERRAICVCVFYCEGLFGFAYRGWWLWLKGLHWDGGKYISRDEKITSKLMELFPVAEPTLFGPPTVGEWMEAFLKHFQREVRRGKPYASAPVWAEFRNGRLERIVERAKWPERMQIC